MTTIAVVPVQHLTQAKSRLAGRLPPPERRALVTHLLNVALEALRGSSLIDQIVVVTPDPAVLDLAAGHGGVGLRENGGGLNAAIKEARNLAMEWEAGTMLVMLGDLPLVRTRDVDELLQAAEVADVVLGPDRHQHGTNALVVRPPDALEPAFGPGSYLAHRAAANASGLRTREVHSPAIAFDIDVPADLDELNRHGVNVLEIVGQGVVAPYDCGRTGQESQEAECRSRHCSPVD